MHTPSHWIMTLAAAKFWHRRGVNSDRPPRKYPRFALALGAWAPDFALTVLSLGGLVWFQNVEGLTAIQSAKHMFGNLFYNDPVWIFLHNFLHSPLMVGLLAAANALLMRPWPHLQRWLTYFLIACFFHDVVDVLTHHDDGPLALFPLNWNWRFASPISYWDPRHGGRPFMVFEIGLNVVLLIFLFRHRRSDLRRNKGGDDPLPPPVVNGK